MSPQSHRIASLCLLYQGCYLDDVFDYSGRFEILIVIAVKLAVQFVVILFPSKPALLADSIQYDYVATLNIVVQTCFPKFSL